MDKYFKTLNVNEDMSLSEIKSAYRKLLKKYHPDTYLGDKDFAEKKTIEINEAYREVVKFKNSNNVNFSKNVKTQKSQSSEQHDEQPSRQWNNQAFKPKQNMSNFKNNSNFSKKTNMASNFDNRNKKENKRKKETNKNFALKRRKVENSSERIDEIIKTEDEIKREKSGKHILDAIIISLSIVTVGLILLFIFMGKSF